MVNIYWHLPIAASMLVMAGSASIDYDFPTDASCALSDTADTNLRRGIGQLPASHVENESGFLPATDGIDSLARRLLLAERAECSIDARYFLRHDDLVGSAILHALPAAGGRGVRVGLLVDGIQLAGCDAGIAALHSHERLAIRIFKSLVHRRKP